VIRGYVEQPSPRVGGQLTLRVATDAPAFRVELYRCGADFVPCAESAWLPGQDAPPHLPFHDWGEPGVGLRGESLLPWPAYPLPIPADWASGVYVAVLVEGDDRGQGAGRGASEPDRSMPDAREAKALAVVRPAPARPGAPARILYKIPVLTYHAYNLVDGVAYDPATRRGQWCLYNLPRPAELPTAAPSGGGVAPAGRRHRRDAV
jgi:hypothetical protein